MSILPNVTPKTFTSSAIFIAYLLMDDLTINEQNAVGDWLMLIGQVLQTNASQAQVLNDRKESYEKQMKTIKKVLNKMNKEFSSQEKDS